MLKELLGFSDQQFVGFMLALIRISALLVVAPFFGSDTVPTRVKIFLSLFLTIMILPIIKQEQAPAGSSLLFLFPLAMKEMFIGLFLGFVARLMFEGFQFAGTLISTQMGLGMSQLVDPESGQQASPIGNIYTLVAIVIFLNLNGHQMLISALYKSFEIAPLYAANVLENAAEVSTARMFNDIFVIGVKLAAPSMVTLFLIEVSTGILARIVPQMNIFFIALPLRLGVGLFIVIATLPIFYLFFQTALAGWQRDIAGILKYF